MEVVKLLKYSQLFKVITLNLVNTTHKEDLANDCNQKINK